MVSCCNHDVSRSASLLWRSRISTASPSAFSPFVNFTFPYSSYVLILVYFTRCLSQQPAAIFNDTCLPNTVEHATLCLHKSLPFTFKARDESTCCPRSLLHFTPTHTAQQRHVDTSPLICACALCMPCCTRKVSQQLGGIRILPIIPIVQVIGREVRIPFFTSIVLCDRVRVQTQVTGIGSQCLINYSMKNFFS